MRKRLLSFATACLVLSAVGVSTSSAQIGSVLTPTQAVGFLVGPIGGINLVAYNSDPFPILSTEKACFTAQNGSDIAAWGGITAEFPLTSEMQSFVIGEVLFDSKSSKFSNQNQSATSIPTKKNGFEADGSVTTALTAQLNYLLINLAYKYNFTQGPSPVGPGIQVGPSVGIRMSSTFNKTVTVVASSGQASPATTTSTLTGATPVDGASAIRLAIRAQATYDIPFTQEWIATPTVGYDFPITKVDNTNRNWRAQSVYAGIAFRYFIRG